MVALILGLEVWSGWVMKFGLGRVQPFLHWLGLGLSKLSPTYPSFSPNLNPSKICSPQLGIQLKLRPILPTLGKHQHKPLDFQSSTLEIEKKNTRTHNNELLQRGKLKFCPPPIHPTTLLNSPFLCPTKLCTPRFTVM